MIEDIMNDEERTKYYLDLYGYIPWTITIADAFDAGLEWDRKEVARALRNAQEKIDFLTKAYDQAATQRDELMQEQKRLLPNKHPIKLMTASELLEAAELEQKKEWVKLTDEEIFKIEDTTTCNVNESWLRNLTRNLEAKLKEKNT